MKVLLDTHILIWAVFDSGRLSREVVGLIKAMENDLLFSAASLWEVAIKTGLARDGFSVDVRRLRDRLLSRGYGELNVLGTHSYALAGLPPIHKDPFDRMLVAQAIAEQVLLVTADPVVARYPGPIRKV